MKKVLITGAGSYIGTSFIKWVKENHPGEFETEELDMITKAAREIYELQFPGEGGMPE